VPSLPILVKSLDQFNSSVNFPIVSANSLFIIWFKAASVDQEPRKTLILIINPSNADGEISHPRSGTRFEETGIHPSPRSEVTQGATSAGGTQLDRGNTS
jgi:hypothetical protein